MSVVMLTNCIICREPILPGTEAAVNHARHDLCTGAQSIDASPTIPEQLTKMFPNSTLDAYTIQTVIGLLEERDFWQVKAKDAQLIVDTLTFQQGQLDKANAELKKLALFYREKFAYATQDPALAQLSASDLAIHLLMKYAELQASTHVQFGGPLPRRSAWDRFLAWLFGEK